MLTRQNIGPIKRENDFQNEDISLGGYTIKGEKIKNPQVVLIASGSEVNSAITAMEILNKQDIPTRVISVPCKELFEAQSDEYRRKLIPDSVEATVVVEAGISFGWKEYFNIPQLKITIDTYGCSGPYKDLEQKYNLTGIQIADSVSNFLLIN